MLGGMRGRGKKSGWIERPEAGERMRWLTKSGGVPELKRQRGLPEAEAGERDEMAVCEPGKAETDARAEQEDRAE